MKRPWKIFARVFFVLVLSIAFLYIRFTPDEQGRIIPWGEKVDTAVLPLFHKSLLSRVELYIFEGLPHQRYEKKLVASEIRTQDTTKIHGHHFYSEALIPTDKDSHSIADAIVGDHAIVEWRGAKLCGGYHPDYAIRWKDSLGKTSEVLVCFGCHEIKLYGDGIQLYADLGDEAYHQLGEALSKYGDKRPNWDNNG